MNVLYTIVYLVMLAFAYLDEFEPVFYAANIPTPPAPPAPTAPPAPMRLHRPFSRLVGYRRVVLLHRPLARLASHRHASILAITGLVHQSIARLIHPMQGEYYHH